MKRRLIALSMVAAAGAQAQSPAPAPAPAGASVAVYRCPGPPVLYTDQITPSEARERNCRLIEGAPVTVIQSPKPRTPAPQANGAPPRAASGPDGGRVEPTAQRQRDAEARRILEAELRREEDKLAGLKREYNNGEPERLGSERNYQTYIDRVAGLKASITRSESDIAALKREIAKLP